MHVSVCILTAACVLAAASPVEKVVTYPAPAGESLSTDYEVWAANQKVDLYGPVFWTRRSPVDNGLRRPLRFGNFDMSGPVVVRVACKRSLRNVVIRPSPLGPSDLEGDHTLTFTLEGPRKVSVEPDGKKGPWLLFANPLETDPPKPDDPNVVYFGPGLHKPEKITLKSNQTLYLAGGSVVKAEVLAEGANIRIRGRGVLDGSDWAWRTGPVGNLIAIRNSTDVEVTGITLAARRTGPLCRATAARDDPECEAVPTRECKNDDGINPCNSAGWC